jgi:5-amino-6-(5-phosphoribosylamino)uracil reductase
VTLQRLHPQPGTVTVAEALAGYDPVARAPADRPYVFANMVATADGRATADGKTAGISSPNDRELFHLLRARADAVMAGTNTMQIENYGPITKTDDLRQERIAAGVREDALAVVVSAGLALPTDIPLFQDPASQIAIYTSADTPPPPCPAQLEVTRLPGRRPDLMEVLRRLRADHGVRALLCEGGPTLLGALVHAGGLDELFLSVGAELAGGGTAPTITTAADPLPEPLPLRLETALLDDEHLFLRYARR